jgi:hypothetical protein
LPEQLIKFFQEVKDKVDKINAHPSTVYTWNGGYFFVYSIWLT